MPQPKVSLFANPPNSYIRFRRRYILGFFSPEWWMQSPQGLQFPCKGVLSFCSMSTQARISFWVSLIRICDGFILISDCDEFKPSEPFCEHKKNGSSSNPGGNFSKKRRDEQYHLDLGQYDFMIYACSLCGLMYARGVEEDEQVHRKFHHDYERGIRFKGWHNERVVDGPWINGDRILLILDTDSSAQKRLVQKVVKATKKELGFVDDNILHALCKVYLFISAHRVVGWLVVEPIRTARRVIPTSFFGSKSTEISTIDKMDLTDSNKSKEITLQFGDFRFRREPVNNSCPSASIKLNKWDSGAIICEENAVSAKCGIMAVWVVPFSRRKRIATQLLDAVRKSFCVGEVLAISECAFSPPTSAGLAFASSYTNSRSFLVYRADDV